MKKRGRRELKRYAYAEAGKLLIGLMDEADFDEGDLTEDEENFVREFIRTTVATQLITLGRPRR